MLDLISGTADIDECSSSPCENGGTCIDLNAEWTSSSSGFTVGYACECIAGYTGDQCTISELGFKFLCRFYGRGVCLLDIDECESTPCQNGGNCSDGIDGYRCNCIPGHTGYNCETSLPFLIFLVRSSLDILY